MLTIINPDGSFRHEITHADDSRSVYEGDADSATMTGFDTQGAETGTESITLAEVTAAVEAARAAAEAPLARILTPFAFSNLLTIEEEIAIEAAAETSPELRVLWRRAERATVIDLDSPLTAQMLDAFVTAGAIKAAAKARILAGDPAPA